MAEGLAQGEIFAVRIDDRLGALEAEAPRGGVDESFVGLDAHDLCQEHVVGAERQDLPHAALDVDGRFGDDGGLDALRGDGREAHLAELVEVASRADAAPVRCACEGAGGEVDDECPRAADDGVGVPLGAHGDIAHRGIGTYRSGPCHGQQVVLFGRGAAAHQHGRQRVEDRSGFPVLFHLLAENIITE